MNEKYHICYPVISGDELCIGYKSCETQEEVEAFIKANELPLDSIVVIKAGFKLNLVNKIVMTPE